MSDCFTTIGLMGRHRRADISDTLLAIKCYLSSCNLNILIEHHTASLLRAPGIIGYPGSQLAKQSDLLIVVGGDGSLLKAARVAVPHKTPVLGINRGCLGFLTDIRPQELEQKIGEVLSGYYKEERRSLLETTLILKNQPAGTRSIALNDIVLMPSNKGCMIEFSITIDQQFVCAQRADGLIIATPTGSTAYALSGGGPILHPQLNAIVLVPMFPHTLTARPIVVSADSMITIHINDNRRRAWLSCDGQIRVPVPLNAAVSISKHHETLRLIHPLDYNYFATLRTKLHWQKAFVCNNDLAPYEKT